MQNPLFDETNVKQSTSKSNLEGWETSGLADVDDSNGLKRSRRPHMVSTAGFGKTRSIIHPAQQALFDEVERYQVEGKVKADELNEEEAA